MKRNNTFSVKLKSEPLVPCPREEGYLCAVPRFQGADEKGPAHRLWQARRLGSGIPCVDDRIAHWSERPKLLLSYGLIRTTLACEPVFGRDAN